jgi:hypothetical protein
MLNKLYIVLATAALGYYSAAGMFGWEFGTPQRTTAPAEVRRSPGWSHSRTGASHFWYTGFRGGK